jgi:hypothetical protein
MARREIVLVRGANGEVGHDLIDLEARGLPTSILIDSGGHRLSTWSGSLTREMLDEEITPLIENQLPQS